MLVHNKEIIIEAVKSQVCDQLCRYPRELEPEEWEELKEELCGDCPLLMLDWIK